MTDAPKMKACPLCKGTAELDGQRGYIPFGEPRGITRSNAVIYCLACGCELSHECEDTGQLSEREYDAVISELITAWNTRTDIADELVDIASKQLDLMERTLSRYALTLEANHAADFSQGIRETQAALAKYKEQT